MASDDAVVFIDTQLYIDLYRTALGKDLLAPLEQQKDYIFITKQIVNEVDRHKLQEAMGFFQKKCQIGKPPGGKLPDHLFDTSGDIVREIREKLNIASDKIKEATRELNKAIAETLRLISLSEDVVSQALAPLFAKAVAHKPEEFERAKVRNARGIPPGKNTGLIGDELNWEQFISFVKESGKRRLWIISKDSDYCLTHYKEAVFLIPTLRQELMCLIDPPPEVRAFMNIPDGIKDFADITGVNADKLPAPERIEEIKKEQEELPPHGWMDTHYYAQIAAHNAHLQHQRAAYYAAIRSQGSPWHPGMMEQAGEITTLSSPQIPPRE